MQLEALPAAGHLPAAPVPAQLRRRGVAAAAAATSSAAGVGANGNAGSAGAGARGAAAAAVAASWRDSRPDGSEGSGPSDADDSDADARDLGDVEVDAPDVAIRFPRILRLLGPSAPELRAAFGAAAAAGAVPERLQREACLRRGSARGGRGAEEERRRQAEEEVVRRLGAWNGVEFRFAGLYARTHLGVPAWVAKYRGSQAAATRQPQVHMPQKGENQLPSHTGQLPCELEVRVMCSNARDGARGGASASRARGAAEFAGGAAEFAGGGGSSSSSSSTWRPAAGSAIAAAGGAAGGAAAAAEACGVVFELSAYCANRQRNAQGRQLSSQVSDQVRFYFNGDIEVSDFVQSRGCCVLRGEAAALDLLFRSPASVPQFAVRSPRLAAARVRISFEKTHPSIQETAGRIYRNIALRGASAGGCPDRLEISGVAGETSGMCGTWRKCTTRSRPPEGGAPQLEPPFLVPLGRAGRGGRPGHAPARNAVGNVGAASPRAGGGAASQEQRGAAAAPADAEGVPLRLREFHPVAFGDYFDTESEASSEASEGESAYSSSDDSQGESSVERSREWVYFYCAETGVLLYPLIWKPCSDEDESADSEDEAMGRPCPKACGRWIFTQYLGGRGMPESGPVLTKPEFRQALTHAFAWADITGDRDLAGEVEVALTAWLPLRSVSISPTFSVEDDTPREVTIPKQVVTYEGVHSPGTATQLWESRCQVLQTTIGLLLKRASARDVARGGLTAADLRAALPLGHWVQLTPDSTYLKVGRTLRHLHQEVVGVFQWPKACNPHKVQFVAVAGPAHCALMHQVPASAADWVPFGGPDLGPLAELVRQCLENGGSLFKAAALVPRAFVHEVRRLANASLELRTCVRPGMLLVALLAATGSARPRPLQDPGTLDLRFEWRIERRPGPGASVAAGSASAQGPDGGRGGAASASGAPAAGAAAGAAADQGTCMPGVGFTLLSNHQDPEHAQPPRFRDFPLRSEQLRTLRWMRAAERSEQAFVFDHEAVDDNVELHQHWQLRGRLRRAAKMRGGILGDKVGYGKTATTIALVECTRGEGAPQVPSSGLATHLPSRATLVLCPVNLISQWVHEVNKFVAGGLNVICLQTYAQLKRTTAQALCEADLVITTYRLFYSAPYLGLLSFLAAGTRRGGGGASSGGPSSSGPSGGPGAKPGPSAAPSSGEAKPPLRRIGPSNSHWLGSPSGEVLTWPPKGQVHIGSVDARRKRAVRIFERQYAQVIRRLQIQRTIMSAGHSASPGGSRMPSAPGVDEVGSVAAPAAPRAAAEGERPRKRLRRKGPPGPGAAEEAEAATAPAAGAAAAPPGGSGAAPSLHRGPQGGHLPRRHRKPRSAQRAAFQGALPLNLFYWKRLVFDEFHEILTNHPPAQVIVKSLSAKYRWGLSGTLPCKTPADVAKMASFFQIDLSGSKRKSNASRAVCQQWLDHCVRRNTAGLPELVSTEEIVLIRQHPAERALYLQLTHAASDADLAGEEDAAALVALRRRGQEGLVKLCSHFQLTGGQLQRSAMDECDAALQRRHREVSMARTGLRKSLEEAWALRHQLQGFRKLFDGLEESDRLWSEVEACAGKAAPDNADASAAESPTEAARRYLQTCLSELRAGGAAGLPVSPLLQRLRRARAPQEPELAAGPQAWEAHRRALGAWRESAAAKAIRGEAEEMHKKACRAATDVVRALRTLEGRSRLVHFFEVTLRTARSEELMKCPICFEDVGPNQRSVLPCAHMGCCVCFEEVLRRDGKCPVCRATACVRQLMRLEAPEALGGAPPTECGRYGSKIMRLLEFLSDLEKREPDAKVILFVQWEDLKRKVAGALEEYGVNFAVLQGGIWVRQRVIEQFQHGPAQEGGRVLLLSVQDSASGTNLTRASHVILFHPVIAHTREASVACEMQAVGRALRAGQTKPVKIWRFVVAGTVEQKVTEEHQRELWERFQAGRLAGTASTGTH